MVAGNFCHVTESDDDDNEEEEFRFNDAFIHQGHLRQNSILTWFGIEMAKRISHIIKSEIA